MKDARPRLDGLNMETFSWLQALFTQADDAFLLLTRPPSVLKLPHFLIILSLRPLIAFEEQTFISSLVIKKQMVTLF
jgi:hypothetical protein